MITHESHIQNKYDTIFMGIDQSLTHTGIVVYEKDIGIKAARGISTSPDTGSIEIRLFHIRSEIQELINIHKPEFIFIEGLAYKMDSNNGRLLAGLFFILLTLFIENNIRYVIVNPKTLKKEVFGSGAASKEEMFSKMKEEEIAMLEELTFSKRKSKKFEDLVDAFWLSQVGIKNSLKLNQI